MFAIELMVHKDGVLSGDVLRAFDPSLRDILSQPGSVAARRTAIESGEVQRQSVRSGATRFDMQVALLSPMVNSRACLRYEIKVTKGEGENEHLPGDLQILDDLPLALTIADRAGTILYVNRSVRRLVGVDDDASIIGRPVWEFVHPAGLDDAHRSGWRVRMGQMARYQRHLLRRVDGTRIPVETTTSEVTWQGEDAVLVASHDLSGIESVERALEDSQRLFSSIFHTAPIAILVSRNRDGRFVDVNPRFLSYIGRQREEVIGKSLAETGVIYDRDKIEAMRELVTSGIDLTPVTEAILVGKDGREHVMLCSACEIEVGGESCMLTTAIDITELRKAVSALEESERRFKIMADAAPVLIWLSDSDGARPFFNWQWLEFVGREMSDEAGSGWLTNIHPADRDRYLAAYRAALERREHFSIDYRLRRADGEYAWMLDRGSPRYETDGRFTGLIGSCVDITERRQSEERLRDAKERAEEMTILKSTFLTNMTHEIRTPLTVILGFTSILRQGTRPEYQRFVTLIERSGRRLLLMLDSILDLAQLEAGTLEPDLGRHDIEQILTGVTASLQPIAADKGIEISVQRSGAVVSAYTDASVIARVLNNLIDNAVKFTEEGEVRIEIDEDPNTVSIHIMDTGVGIHEEFLPRVFDAFSQESTGLARSHQGSGLGMTVSKQLLEVVGGSLTVSSEKEVGSHIIIQLPARPDSDPSDSASRTN